MVFEGVITSLSPKDKDPVFAQYLKDVEEANRAIVQKKKDFIPKIYYYTVTGEDKNLDEFMEIAARCSIPQETLATINRIHSSDTDIRGKKLIVPAARGLFIPQKPESALEILLQKRYPDYEKFSKCIVNNCVFWYIGNGQFAAEERAFFLDSSMGMPLADSVLTSGFGARRSPFTGTWQFHRGVDLAAPIGTAVFACKGGTVGYIGFNEVYGNYIIVTHANKTESLYAHLSVISVKANVAVKKGEQIGKVGVTGATTGPHLHFEIRVNDTPQDPGRLLKGI